MPRGPVINGDFDSVIWGGNLRTCISNLFSGDTDDDGLRFILEFNLGTW